MIASRTVFFEAFIDRMKSGRPSRTSAAEVRTRSATTSMASLVFPFDWECCHTQSMASKVTSFFFLAVRIEVSAAGCGGRPVHMRLPVFRYLRSAAALAARQASQGLSPSRRCLRYMRCSPHFGGSGRL